MDKGICTGYSNSVDRCSVGGMEGMNTEFAIYQLRIELWNLLFSDWLSQVMTVKYWGIIAFILLYYAIWWKLTDKRRISDLILFGSLLSVARIIYDLAGVSMGLWFYKDRIEPLSPTVFLHDVTIIPLTLMLAQQYSPNWKQFFIWAGLASAYLTLIILPIFSALEMYQLMKWNFLYAFLAQYAIAIFIRGAFHLVKQVQYKAVAGYNSPFQNTLMQPAFKPIDEDTKEND